MKYQYKIFFIILGLTNILLAQGFGSSGALGARNIALGGTNGVSARGVHAIGVNPANLAIQQEHSIEVSTLIPLPTLNITAGNDFITLNDYNYFFTGVEGENGEINGRYLDASEKSKFLDLFAQGSMVSTNFGTTILSASIYLDKKIGAFGFAISDWTSVQASLPTQMFELALYGNEVNKVFDLKDMDVKAWYLRNYSLSYSRDLSEYFTDAFKFFSAGLTLKLVHGYFYAGVDKINTTLKTQTDYGILINGDSRMLVAASPSFGIIHDFEDDEIIRDGSPGLFNAPAGTGFGLDFGFYADLNKVWSIAFALTDLGSINWKKGTVQYTSESDFLLDDVTDEELVDSLSDAITGEGSYTGAFSTSLSTAMKMGVGFRVDKLLKGNFPGTLLFELNYHQGFNNMPANSKIPRFSLGTEWYPITWFNVRTGLSVGGYDDFNWAFGFGFDSGLLDFDFASAYTHSILNGNNAKRLGFAISTRWKF